MWHAEHGNPYLRANAGMAYPGWLVVLTNEARNRVSIQKEFENKLIVLRWVPGRSCMQSSLLVEHTSSYSCVNTLSLSHSCCLVHLECEVQSFGLTRRHRDLLRHGA